MRRATIKTSALGLIALTATVVLTTLMWHEGSATARVTQPAAVQAKDVRRLLAVAGIEPLALVAAGGSAQDASRVVGQARSYLAEYQDSMDSAIHAASAAALRSARRAPEETLSASELRATAATARAARDSAIASFRSAALDGLNETIVAKLNNIRSNRSQGLPMQYLVKDRTSDEWAALRNGLAAAKTAEKRGIAAPTANSSMVTEASSDAWVSSAAESLNPTNLATVKAAWNAGFETPSPGGQP